MSALELETPTLQELLDLVESNPSLATTDAKAEALVQLIPDSEWREMLEVVVERLLALRAQRGSRDPGPTERSPLDARATQPSPRPQARNPGAVKKPQGSKAPVRHASQKIALATRTWIDLLSTQVALPGMEVKVEVRDMTVDQLHSLADSLFDTSERVHRLAEHVTLNAVKCARDLEPKALEACMAEDAA